MTVDESSRGLTFEQRRGLGACGSSEERTAYCREHDIALPDEALEGIAGGQVSGYTVTEDDLSWNDRCCKECGSRDIDIEQLSDGLKISCRKCGAVRYF